MEPPSTGIYHYRGAPNNLGLKSQMIKPLISVITVSLNASQFLEQTILSVISQTYPYIEYIIIDGGSTDGTIEIIRKYENNIYSWISEPDQNIYDAMNKGIYLANGNWIYFLGAGDVIISFNIIQSIFTEIEHIEKYDLIFGYIIYGGKRLYKSRFNSLLKFKNTIHHQGTFYKRELFDNFHYDTKLRALSDYELNLRLYLAKAKAYSLRKIVANCSESGVSGQAKFANYKEEMIIRKKLFLWPERSLYNISSLIRYIYKRIKCI